MAYEERRHSDEHHRYTDDRDAHGRSDGNSHYSSAAPKQMRGRDPNPEPSHVLGVFGMSHATSETTLRDVFSRYGDIDKCMVVYDARSRESRGFGFVYYRDVEAASAAREATNGMELDGRNIRVDFSVTKKPHEPTPGRYLGPRRRSNSRDRYRRRDDYNDRRRSRSRDRYRRDDYDRRDRRDDYNRRDDYDRRDRGGYNRDERYERRDDRREERYERRDDRRDDRYERR